LDTERVLAFRLARSGLTSRAPASGGLTAAAACPASDFSRDAALLALAARAEGVTREAYDDAVDAGDLVVAHVMRGAIHALAPDDHALYGRALVATDDAELGAQMGRQVQGLDVAPGAALHEATEAVRAVLADGAKLDKNDLHAALRERVDPALMPWCKGCGSHHVASMLWRYAAVAAGARYDAQRRHVLAKGRRAKTPDATAAVRRFLSFYGPGTPATFAEWAGLARPHARRLWDAVETEETADGGAILPEDATLLDAPPTAHGLRLLPPGDPYLQKANRPLLAPDDALRKRLFRPVASPGAVLQDGHLIALWRAKAKGKTTTLLEVEPLAKTPKLRQGDLDDEAERLAALRGTPNLTLDVAA
jgi:hypothetical protein